MSHRRPANGVYEGYFTIGGKRRPLEADLRWTSAHEFAGEGADELENFTLSGAVQGATTGTRCSSPPPGSVDAAPPYKVVVERRGNDGVRRRGEGFREGASGGMFGAWTARTDGTDERGDFSLKPSAAGSQSQLRAKKRGRIAQELSHMGYEEWLVADALEATKASSLADCVTWISDQLQKLASSSGDKTTPLALVDNSNNNTDASSGAAAGSDDAIATLISMGFPDEQCAEALRVCDGNVERALEYLVGPQ